MVESSVSPYLFLKLAQELYGKSPQALETGEVKRISSVARRQAEIEERILGTLEASSVVLPSSSVDQAITQVRSRYEGEQDFQADLLRNDLTQESLRTAIERDLTVEAVLEQVATRAEPVTDTEVEIFYLQHIARFQKPEIRTLRHILVTINEHLPGSERDAALKKVEAIRARLIKDVTRFAEQAMKHSECPTAMQGGLLGNLARGKLYPELDEIAFSLPVGQLSTIIESPLGFHVVLCDAVDLARVVPFEEAQAGVQRHLAESRRQAQQKNWIKELFKEN